MQVLHLAPDRRQDRGGFAGGPHHQHLRPALIGVALGLAGSLALARYLQSMVFGVGATDPLTLIAMGLTLLTVAVAACLIPARRATHVDALVALRNQ